MMTETKNLLEWVELQKQVADWAQKNFGNQAPWQPMLGLVEEIGEFFAARTIYTHDLSSRPIRAFEAMVDAIGDQVVYALNLAQKCEVELGVVIIIDRPQVVGDVELWGAVAAASHAVLKNAQGIRGVDTQKLQQHMIVALGLWLSWVSFQCEVYKLGTILGITKDVWAGVRKRDWRQNPTNAHEATKGSSPGEYNVGFNPPLDKV